MRSIQPKLINSLLRSLWRVEEEPQASFLYAKTVPSPPGCMVTWLTTLRRQSFTERTEFAWVMGLLMLWQYLAIYCRRKGSGPVACCSHLALTARAEGARLFSNLCLVTSCGSLEITCTGRTYTMETGQCSKSGAFPTHRAETHLLHSLCWEHSCHIAERERERVRESPTLF